MSEFEHQSSGQDGLSNQTTGDTGGTDDGSGFTGEGFGGEGFKGDDGMDPIIVEAPRKKRTGAIVLIVVIGLAIGSLFSMHTLTKVTASSGRSTDIEKTVEEFLRRVGGVEGTDGGESGTELVENHQKVVAVLKDNYTEHQVKGLERNPFNVFEGGPSQPDGGVFGLAQRREQFEMAAEKLRLKSVIGGSRPLANINGRIVRLNQSIPVQISRTAGSVNFKVIEITRNSVTVVAEEPKLDLRVVKIITLDRNR